MHACSAGDSRPQPRARRYHARRRPPARSPRSSRRLSKHAPRLSRVPLEEGTAFLRTALASSHGNADVRIHGFGERLVPVDVDAFLAGGSLARPEDADTQLAPAFRQLASRLGRESPTAVIVVSDGRVRDPETVDEMAALWNRLHVPVHVVPLGRPNREGDVAIIAAIAPAKVRNQSQVDVNMFLRSFGFAGERVELQLQSLDENGAVRRTVRTIPVSLQDGVQTLTLTFGTEPDLKRLRLHIPPFPLATLLRRTTISHWRSRRTVPDSGSVCRRLCRGRPPVWRRSRRRRGRRLPFPQRLARRPRYPMRGVRCRVFAISRGYGWGRRSTRMLSRKRQPSYWLTTRLCWQMFHVRH